MSNTRNLPNLPSSNDSFWEGAEKYPATPVSISICPDHTKEKWLEHKGYNYNGDGTISCQMCPWGARINTGKYRVVDGMIVDLQNPSSRHA
jgi:hypothetical protein